MKQSARFLQTLKIITTIFEFIPFILGCFFIKKFLAKELRVFFIYLIQAAILIALATLFILYYRSINKYYLVTRIFTLTEYILLAYFFSLHIKNKVFSKIILLSIIPFTIFCLFDYYTAKQASIAFFPLVIECIFFLFTIVYIFFEKMQDDEVLIPLYETTFFWIATAFVLNFAGNLVLFMYARVTPKVGAFEINFNTIYAGVTITKNIFLCIGITLKEKRNRKSANGNGEIPFSEQNLDFLDFDNDSR